MYRYSINGTSVSPINGGAYDFRYELQNNSAVIYKLVTDSKFVFTYSDNFDFKQQEEDDKCEELDFLIERLCGGVWSIFWEGVFSIVEGEFDDNKCLYTITPRIKEFMVEDLQINIFDDTNVVQEGGVFGFSRGGTNVANPNYRNFIQARYFDSILLFVAKKSNPRITGLISDFFQINPVNVSADCIPGVFNFYKYMVFCAVSDIQEPIPSNLATKEYVTFKALMEDLQVLFNVHWFVDSNWNLRIEHESFFAGTTGIDLTQTPYSNYIRGKTKYSYDLNEFPKKEIWKVADSPESASVTYHGMSNIGKRQGEKTYQTRLIRNYLGVNLSNDGVYLFATDGGSTFGFLHKLDIQTGQIIDPMNIGWLVYNLHKDNRPSLYGVIERHSKYEGYLEAGAIINNSIKPAIRGEELIFPLCCSDTLNPEDTILTSLGQGKIEKGSFDQKTSMAKVVLKYSPFNCDDFDPLTISGMDLWLKKGVGVSVSQWDDSSGNGRHAVQATAINQPTITAGGALKFTQVAGGNLQFMNTPSFQLFPSKRGTVICLLEDDFGSNIGNMDKMGAMILSSNGANAWDLSLSATKGGPGVPGPLPMGSRYKCITMGGNIWNGDPLSSFVEFGTYFPQHQQLTDVNIESKFRAGLFVITRTSDTTIYTKQDGVKISDNPLTDPLTGNLDDYLTVPNTQPAASAFTLGGNASIVSDLDGEVNILEVMVFDRVLTDLEIEYLEFYFVKSGYFNTYPYLLP